MPVPGKPVQPSRWVKSVVTIAIENNVRSKGPIVPCVLYHVFAVHPTLPDEKYQGWCLTWIHTGSKIATYENEQEARKAGEFLVEQCGKLFAQHKTALTLFKVLPKWVKLWARQCEKTHKCVEKPE